MTIINFSCNSRQSPILIFLIQSINSTSNDASSAWGHWPLLSSRYGICIRRRDVEVDMTIVIFINPFCSYYLVIQTGAVQSVLAAWDGSGSAWWVTCSRALGGSGYIVTAAVLGCHDVTKMLRDDHYQFRRIQLCRPADCWPDPGSPWVTIRLTDGQGGVTCLVASCWSALSAMSA